MSNTYVVRGEGGKFSKTFKDGGFVAVGWFGRDSRVEFELEKATSRQYVKEMLLKGSPDDVSPVSVGLATGMNYRFINEMSIGDTVLSPTYNNKVMIGTIMTDCYMEKNDDFDPFLRRKVNWADDIDKSLLSEDIKQKLYCNLTFFSVDEEIDMDQFYGLNTNDDSKVFEKIEDDCIDDECGEYAYFMESQTIPNVYKIGKAKNVEIRQNDLLKDNRYGLFNLKTKGWVKVKDPYRFERMFHLYYQRYRLSTKNGLKVDTELFKTDKDLYKMWVDFVSNNYLKNDIMKDEIIEYNLG
jgi:predicted Mrr-cat superfamily restriction endonuclease